MREKTEKLLALLAPILVELRPNITPSEWAVSVLEQEDADELVEYFGDILERQLLLDYWDSYLCLIHYSASLNPSSEINDFTAFLIGIGTLKLDANDENQAQHVLQVGRQRIANNFE